MQYEKSIIQKGHVPATIPTKIWLQDLGQKGCLLSAKEMAWLNRYLKEHPNPPTEITKVISHGHLRFTIFIINRNYYAVYDREILGKGSYGTIKIGQNIVTKEWVAIKIQKINKANIEAERKVRKEITYLKKMGQLKNSVTIERKNTNQIYIVQTIIGKGHDLRYYISRAKTRDKIIHFDERLDVAISALKDLKLRFHDKDIIHSDIKPRNMVYDKINRKIQIIDLGDIIDLKKAKKSELFDVKGYKRTGYQFFYEITPKKNSKIDNNCCFFRGYSFGTKAYMCPELYLPYTLFSKKSDIYAMGMTLYYLMATNKIVENQAFPLLIDCYSLITKMCSYDLRVRPTVEQTIRALHKIKEQWIMIKKLRARKEIKTKDGNTLLMKAIVSNNIEAIKLILKNKNLDLNVKNSHNQTALMIAVDKNNIEAVMMLLGDVRTKIRKNRTIFTLVRSQIIRKLLKQRSMLDRKSDPKSNRKS